MAGTIAECGFEASCELCSGTSWCKDIGIYIYRLCSNWLYRLYIFYFIYIIASFKKQCVIHPSLHNVPGIAAVS